MSKTPSQCDTAEVEMGACLILVVALFSVLLCVSRGNAGNDREVLPERVSSLGFCVDLCSAAGQWLLHLLSASPNGDLSIFDVVENVRKKSNVLVLYLKLVLKIKTLL